MAGEAPSPGTALSLTFQVLALGQEAAGCCHGESLWVSASSTLLTPPPTLG